MAANYLQAASVESSPPTATASLTPRFVSMATYPSNLPPPHRHPIHPPTSHYPHPPRVLFRQPCRAQTLGFNSHITVALETHFQRGYKWDSRSGSSVIREAFRLSSVPTNRHPDLLFSLSLKSVSVVLDCAIPKILLIIFFILFFLRNGIDSHASILSSVCGWIWKIHSHQRWRWNLRFTCTGTQGRSPAYLSANLTAFSSVSVKMAPVSCGTSTGQCVCDRGERNERVFLISFRL